MASSNISISGLKELDELMKNLPTKIEVNVMRGALRAGQKVMLEGAKSNLASITKQDTGLLAKSLKIRFEGKSLKYGWLRTHLVAGSKDAYYAHMVEFGTAAHYISIKKEVRPGRMTRRGEKKFSVSTINEMVNRGSLKIGGQFVGASVAHPGSQPKPFMRRTFDSCNLQAINAVAEYIRKRLPKELKKAGR